MVNDTGNLMMLSIVGVVVYLVVLLISILIGYLILKAAVKNGTLQALRQAKQERLIP